MKTHHRLSPRQLERMNQLLLLPVEIYRTRAAQHPTQQRVSVELIEVNVAFMGVTHVKGKRKHVAEDVGRFGIVRVEDGRGRLCLSVRVCVRELKCEKILTIMIRTIKH